MYEKYEIDETTESRARRMTRFLRLRDLVCRVLLELESEKDRKTCQYLFYPYLQVIPNGMAGYLSSLNMPFTHPVSPRDRTLNVLSIPEMETEHSEMERQRTFLIREENVSYLTISVNFLTTLQFCRFCLRSWNEYNFLYFLSILWTRETCSVTPRGDGGQDRTYDMTALKG